MKDLLELGKMLKNYRLDRRLSVENLADGVRKLGRPVSTHYLKELEREIPITRFAPSYELLLKLSKALTMSMEDTYKFLSLGGYEQIELPPKDEFTARIRSFIERTLEEYPIQSIEQQAALFVQIREVIQKISEEDC